MFIISGIDGTGDYNDIEYKKHFKESYVKKLTSNVEKLNIGIYRRGPSTEGYSTARRGADAANEIAGIAAATAALDKKCGIFLTGFSRGGASVIHAAQLLGERKIGVDALFLFDAVDRAIGVDSAIIPPTVKTVYHALRSKDTDSRTLFSNTGTRYYKEKTKYVHKWFHCTHGAIGGTPWTHAGVDKAIYETSGTSYGMALLLTKSSPVPANVIVQGAAHLYLYASRTKVTLEQEKTQSVAVQDWMFKNFEREIGALK